MAQTGHANGGDWREEVYQRIQRLKDLYFADMNEMSQKIALKLQRHDSLEQPKTEQLEKLRSFKAMLDKSMAFLQLNKNSIAIHHKDKLPRYEKEIVSFVSSNRARRPASSLQQAQLVLTDNNNWRPIQSGEPTVDTMSLDSMAQTGHANGGDWREEVYQRENFIEDDLSGDYASVPSNTVGTSSKTPVPGNVFKPSLRVRRKKNALKRVKKSRDPKGSML